MRRRLKRKISINRVLSFSFSMSGLYHPKISSRAYKVNKTGVEKGLIFET